MHALEPLDDDGPEHPEGHHGAAHGGHPHPRLLEALLLLAMGWWGVVWWIYVSGLCWCCCGRVCVGVYLRT